MSCTAPLLRIRINAQTKNEPSQGARAPQPESVPHRSIKPMQWKRPTWAQALLRDTVIKREERLYLPPFRSASLRNVAATPKTGHLILQAIPRANSATYADSRLVV